MKVLETYKDFKSPITTTNIRSFVGIAREKMLLLRDQQHKRIYTEKSVPPV